MAGKPKVVGGVDTHADTMHVSVLTLLGRKLADKEFRTDARGYWDAIRFMTTQGSVQAVGVEGTSSYGAGLDEGVDHGRHHSHRGQSAGPGRPAPLG
jgi:hypothetical protein